MTNLSEISVVKIFRGLILDSLMKDGFIHRPQSTESFFSRHKKLILTSTAVVAGAALGPLMIGGAVAALGFGEAGIAAGSIAAWMMSLHRGYVAAGSLVAILQSVGAAGLGLGGIIAAGFGGGILAGAISKALLIILESNPEGLAELEDNYVSITNDDDDDDENSPTKVNFEVKQQLLDNNDEYKKMKSFLKGFDLAVQVINDRTKIFEFLIDRNRYNDASNFMQKHLEDTYKNKNYSVTTLEQRGILLSLNDNLND